MIEILSIDLSNYCSKGCSFCYNRSNSKGQTVWHPEEVISFASDCIGHGVKAVSLGGGEPFEYAGVFDIIDALYDKCYLSVTTNGLPLRNESVWGKLLLHRPDKIHITIHNPNSQPEVERVLKQVVSLSEAGIKPGVNLLVGGDKVEAARLVYLRMTEIIALDQVILVPQRFSNVPSPMQVASVASGNKFQSASCLQGCRRPVNFASISWDKKASSCSFVKDKQPLQELSYNGLERALEKTVWQPCE